jgi:hypothetical protein
MSDDPFIDRWIGQRLGRFAVDAALPIDGPDILRQIMVHCLIVNASLVTSVGKVIYVALSDQFESCPDIMQIPEYEVVMRGASFDCFVKIDNWRIH